MANELEAEIGDAECVALNYARSTARPKLATFFALDRRLGQIVAGSNEPMLGQMRLAWWRDMLEAPDQERPSGDVVLDAIRQNWGEHANALQPLVDGWEVFLVAEALTDEVLREFASGRARAIAQAFDCADEQRERQAREAGTLWAFADTAAHVSDESERERILRLARASIAGKTSRSRVPTALAVLSALSIRAIARGGRPLMEGRGAALTALRAGLIGR